MRQALALLALALAATAAGKAAYLVTDTPDVVFVQAGLGGWLPEGRLLGPGDVLGAAALPRVVAAFDPNWGQGGKVLFLNVSSRLVDHVLRGGVVVAGLNGAVLLNLTTRNLGLPLPPLAHSECAPAPSSYNYSKYGCLPKPVFAKIEPVSSGMVAYLARLGDGWLVLLPYNIVWAYSDTRDEAYLATARDAMRLAERLPAANSLPASLVAASATIAATVAAAAASRSEKGRGKGAPRVVPQPAWTRVRREDALQHPLRRRIYELVSENGAVSFNELWRTLGVAKATVAWHVSVLERLGLLATLRYRRRLFIYRAGEAGVRSLFHRLVSQDTGLCRLLEAVEAGLGVEEAAARLRLRPGSLRQLYSLLEKHRDGAEEACRELGGL